MTDNLIGKLACESCGKEIEIKDIFLTPITAYEVCEDCLNA